ncbi:MAG: Bug family tripartite tricarboxylate transporter substrate binding protein [Burkholderiales bacterium]
MDSWRRAQTLVFLLVFESIVAIGGSSAIAQEYPNRPVRMIVTFSPGGFTDLTARIVAQHWTERFGQPVLVENRAGRSTVVGTDAVAKAKPDGYTLLFTGASSFTINTIVLRDLPYDPLKSFAPIGIVGTTGMMVLAHPSVAARTVPELVAMLSAKPGQYNYGSFGSGTVSHFAAEYFWSVLGGKLVHVPYKGSGPLMAALVANEVPLSVDTVVVAGPQIRAGKIKAFAVTTATRSTLLPDVPTLAESGYPGIDVGAWVALAAPAGTPDAVLKKLRDETVRLRTVKDVREKFAALGVEIIGSTPEEFTAKVTDETRRFSQIAKDSNIRAD